MKKFLHKPTISFLPKTFGVYLFFGKDDILLYVGKSNNVRKRVGAHFAARDERWLTKLVRRIEAQETAGDLGALLLESRLIKELHPIYNVRAKQPRRIIIARREDNEAGYATVRLEAVEYLDFKSNSPVLGVFKHKTQAIEFLSTVARTHRLCPKLLRLESRRGCCFSYHLGHCSGACIGEEDVQAYNARVDAAFEARRIASWPFQGAVRVEEKSKSAGKETFIIDNWCLIASYKDGSWPDPSAPERAAGLQGRNSSLHRFDYDSYKILYSYLTDERNRRIVTPADS
jgi:DNA polymerase-3 subunit epsilon